jgi:hypothetical protein
MSPEPLDDKPDNVPSQPNLAAAIRQARVENPERAEAIAELRELEMGRLLALEGALRPIVDQAPPDVDLFDLAIAPGRASASLPRHDRLRGPRQMHLSLLSGHPPRPRADRQNQSADAIAAAVADYVARRLAERERALAADWRVDRTPQPPSRPGASAPRVWPIAKPQ